MTTKSPVLKHSINSRAKGAGGERELAKILQAMFPGLTIRRGQQFKGSPDSPDVVGLDGVHIECKRTSRLNINAAFLQAKKQCGSSIPAVFHRADQGEWLVTVALGNLLNFCWVIDDDASCEHE